MPSSPAPDPGQWVLNVTNPPLQALASLSAEGGVPDAIQMALEGSGALRGRGTPLLVISRRATLDMDAVANPAGPAEIQTVVWQHGGGTINPHDIQACEDLLDTYFSQARQPLFPPVAHAIEASCM